MYAIYGSCISEPEYGRNLHLTTRNKFVWFDFLATFTEFSRQGNSRFILSFHEKYIPVFHSSLHPISYSSLLFFIFMGNYQINPSGTTLRKMALLPHSSLFFHPYIFLPFFTVTVSLPIKPCLKRKIVLLLLLLFYLKRMTKRRMLELLLLVVTIKRYPGRKRKVFNSCLLLVLDFWRLSTAYNDSLDPFPLDYMSSTFRNLSYFSLSVSIYIVPTKDDSRIKIYSFEL